MNNWTVVSTKKKQKGKTQQEGKISLKMHDTTHKNERILLQSVNSSYSNKGPFKNPRHGQGNRKTEYGQCRTFNRSQTKVKHPNPEVAIRREIQSETIKSPEKLKNLQSAINFEVILRKLVPHGSTKGQINALKRALFEQSKVKNAISQLYLNPRPSVCPSAPNAVKKKQVERSLCSSKRLFH